MPESNPPLDVCHVPVVADMRTAETSMFDTVYSVPVRALGMHYLQLQAQYSSGWLQTDLYQMELNLCAYCLTFFR